MSEINLKVGKSLPIAGAKKATTVKETMYKLAKMSYGHWRNYRHILSGTAVMTEKDNVVSWAFDENADIAATHKKFCNVKNFEMGDNNTHDGWVICAEKDIPVLTKYINDFFGSELAKKYKVESMFTLLRICEPYTNDANVKPTAPAITNELVPEVAKVD